MSGTGPVAEGVEFTDGAVALRWYGDYPTTTVWDGIDSVIAIHGHGGATEIEWLDPDPGPDPTVARREDLPPQPWPELHPAPESEDEGPGPSLSGGGGHGSAGTPGAARGSAGTPGAARGSGGTAGAADGSGESAGGADGAGGSVRGPGAERGSGQRATRPIFPAEHGTAGPVFPGGHRREPFSEFMDNGGQARRRTGFTDLL